MAPFVELCADGVDFNNRKMLAVTTAALVALAALLFEDDYLRVLFVFKDGCFNASTVHEWGAELCVCTFAHHEDFVEVDGVACFRTWEGVNLKDITFSDGKLAALCSNSGFHDKIGKNGGEKRSGWGNQEVFSEFYRAPSWNRGQWGLAMQTLLVSIQSQ